MPFDLDPVEVRVLGSLIEKEIATPEYYPLTLNALLNACNQRSSRDPVTSYSEEEIEDALRRLRENKLLSTLSGAGNRVPKHRQLLSEVLNLGRREIAVLCTLLLRGYQTVGELRGRSERLYQFSDLEEVQTCLDHLITREPEPLVVKLPRQPGTTEPRYAHLLSPLAPVSAATEPDAQVASPPADRLTTLEQEVSQLRKELDSMKAELERFRMQFE